MDLVARCAEQIPLQTTDNSACVSKLMLAEVQSLQNSSDIIGRRQKPDSEEPRFLVLTNPFDTNVNPNGGQIIRDRTGLEVQTVGSASAEFQKRMLEQIQLLPEGDRRQLAAAGIKILIAGRVTDAEPSIANERPRNWPSQATQQDTDGIYLGDQRAVVVAESTRRGPNNRAEGVLRHEVGHALNDAFGNFSNTKEFMHAYQADLNRMNGAQQSRMSFWRQKGDAGRDETFADVYAALRGGVPNAEETKLITQAFPRVTEIVRRRLQ